MLRKMFHVEHGGACGKPREECFRNRAICNSNRLFHVEQGKGRSEAVDPPLHWNVRVFLRQFPLFHVEHPGLFRGGDPDFQHHGTKSPASFVPRGTL